MCMGVHVSNTTFHISPSSHRSTIPPFPDGYLAPFPPSLPPRLLYPRKVDVRQARTCTTSPPFPQNRAASPCHFLTGVETTPSHPHTELRAIQ
jgi:hypothetical protein